MSENLKSETIHGVFWSFVERYSVQTIQLVLNIVMARLLSPESFGLIAMLSIFMSLSQVFIDGGFSSALIQNKNRTEEDFCTVFYINISISILIYLILFFSAPFIADFYHQPLLKAITRIYSLNLIVNSLVAVNKTKLTIALDFKTQSKISLSSAIVSGGIGIVCAIMGMGVWALVAQLMSATIINMCLSFFFVKWFPKAVFSKDSFHRLFAFGSKLLVAQIISSIYNNIYNLVIGKKFSSSELGCFSNADKISNFASTNIAGILTRVSFPLLSKIQDDDERLISVYKKYIQMSAFIVFPVILGICGAAKPLILALLTEKWAGAISILQVLSFAYLFDCIISVNLNLIYVKGRSDLVLRLEIIKKAIALAILGVTMSFFGILGICYGRVLYALIAFYLNTYYTNKLLHYGFFQQLKDILPYLLAALFISGEAFALSSVIDNNWIALCASMIVCPLTYIGISSLFKFYAFSEIKGIIIGKLKKNA